VRVEVLDDAAAFASLAEPVLRADPMGTTTLASSLQRRLSLRSTHPGWWFVVLRADEPVAVAMLDAPWPPFLAPMPADAAEAVAEAIAGVVDEVPGFNGEQNAVSSAVSRWQRLHPHVQVTSVRRERLHRLVDLTVPDVAGVAAVAQVADADLVLRWSTAFADEVGTLSHDLETLVRHRLVQPDGGYRLWTVEGRPVSLAGIKPPDHGVARIGPVYTPPEHRRRGYAGAVTAAASTSLRDAGALEVVLFTDLANPTSNRIYREIGYRPVQDFVEVRLGP
jgi:RimJ/RimL family protein N-acetyltransferase